MRQIVDRPIWVGHAGDLRNASAVLSAGIEAVAELADNEPPAVFPREIVQCRFPLSDSGETPAWLLRLAIDSVASLVNAAVPTLVGCSNGMNRSVCIVAAAMALAEGRSLDAALNDVARTGSIDVSPRLLAAIRAVLASGNNQ